MAAKKSKTTKQPEPAVTYRHGTKRKHIPLAGLAAQGEVKEAPKIQFAYNPHLPPVLRFDPTGQADRLPELLEQATRRPLSREEAKLIAEALRNHEPWLEWAGKREKKGFEVDPVALHIHERISAQAILKVAAREDVQPDLFADPQLEYQKAVQFYQHDVDWANRMILGDSLQVMASLARREDLAGKVQMIYMDPPYGIKFASNFQPEIGRRDVKDKETDLTREPEMVKAYRDTWTLGVHSYLAYLRDRLILCRELLADTGSIFVQIGDENLHRVRCVMDEVFGQENFVSVIFVAKTSGFGQTATLASVGDFLLWYAKDQQRVKYRQIYLEKTDGSEFASEYRHIESPEGLVRRALTREEENRPKSIPERWRRYRPSATTSQGATESGVFEVEFEGVRFSIPPGQHWKTSVDGMKRLAQSGRLLKREKSISYIRYLDDFPVVPASNNWSDLRWGFDASEKRYVVETNPRIVARCMLMTTDPGDLVLDPTCGSGTTAYVAEQWGRRWITIDTSRVALALARQRLLTARFDFYKLRPVNAEDVRRNPAGPWLPGPDGKPHTFDCKTVPHITLKSIAQNVALDAIFAKHQPILDERLKALNEALKLVTPKLRSRLAMKLAEKQKREGKKAVTDADRRRWLLPPNNREKNAYTTVPNDFAGWYEWEVPFDTDPDWPKPLQEALVEYRKAWRAKMDEVNAAIAANAEQEELVDQPEVERGVVRVSGPFTMEAVMPAEESLLEESPIGGEPEALETFGEEGRGSEAAPTLPQQEPRNAEAYLDKMVRLLRADGVRFPNNKVATFTRLERISDAEFLHAEGEWSAENGKERRVAVSFGPQFGPVTAYQVENALRYAHRRGYDDLVLAGFSFDGAAQAIIQEDPNPKVRCHLAHIRPDVNMGDLLKQTPGSQIFTVFGSPRTKLERLPDGQWQVTMEGVDIYNPVENTVLPTSADKVAAWFLDSDYDGRTFCVTQAFFPDKSAWEKLARALKGVIDEAQFAKFSGTVSLPFPQANTSGAP